MSLDLVALVAQRPDTARVLTGVVGPRGPLPSRAEAHAVHLYDPAGPLLVAVETPQFVQVAGEVERLLGVTAPVPVWWVDIRAAAEPELAQALARAVGDELVRRYGGLLWTGGTP